MPRSHWFLSSNKHPNIQRYKATKIHTLTPLTYELFFQNSSKRKRKLGSTGERNPWKRGGKRQERRKKKKKKRKIEILFYQCSKYSLPMYKCNTLGNLLLSRNSIAWIINEIECIINVRGLTEMFPLVQLNFQSCTIISHQFQNWISPQESFYNSVHACPIKVLLSCCEKKIFIYTKARVNKMMWTGVPLLTF